MELQSSFPDAVRLGAAVSFTSGYASALADQQNRADPFQLDKFDQSFRRLIDFFKDLPEKLPDDESIDNARSSLEYTTFLIEGLRLLVSVRSSFLEKNPEMLDFWTDDAQETLEDTLELFEDKAETLALGLNPAFHDEIESARKEAGLAPDAKTGLPTR